MFNFVGAEAINGAIKKLGESGGQIAQALTKAGQDAWKSTVLPPILLDIFKEIPQYWESLPDEQKQALFNALIAAGTKALMSYSDGKGKVAL